MSINVLRNDSIKKDLWNNKYNAWIVCGAVLLLDKPMVTVQLTENLKYLWFEFVISHLNNWYILVYYFGSVKHFDIEHIRELVLFNIYTDINYVDVTIWLMPEFLKNLNTIVSDINIINQIKLSWDKIIDRNLLKNYSDKFDINFINEIVLQKDLILDWQLESIADNIVFLHNDWRQISTDDKLLIYELNSTNLEVFKTTLLKEIVSKFDVKYIIQRKVGYNDTIDMFYYKIDIIYT